MDILIKDNVFDNVDEIRQQGLDRTDYEYRDQPCAPGWKGYRSWFNEDEGDIICQQIINIVGDVYDIRSCPFRRFAYHVTDIPSCIEKQPLFHDFKWHNDGNIPGTYAGIVYLHPNPPPNSGSSVLDSEKNEIIDGSLIKKGDKIIGLPSSGLHSNGYTLVNDMLWRHKITFNHSYIGKPMPELLTPTTIYAKQVDELMDEIPIVGMAHITGGGIEENVNRIMPEGLKAQIDWNSWRFPEVFSKIMLAGEIPEEEMKRVFNCGIGYVLIVPPEVEYGMQIGEVV